MSGDAASCSWESGRCDFWLRSSFRYPNHIELASPRHPRADSRLWRKSANKRASLPRKIRPHEMLGRRASFRNALRFHGHRESNIIWNWPTSHWASRSQSRREHHFAGRTPRQSVDCETPRTPLAANHPDLHSPSRAFEFFLTLYAVSRPRHSLKPLGADLFPARHAPTEAAFSNAIERRFHVL